MHYWLMKTEPTTFSFDDLWKAPKRTTSWDGVRNYTARNYMRDQMKKGDLVLLESLDYSVQYDRTATSVHAFRVKDSRGGTWTFLDDRKNPLMLEYRNPYYVQKVRTITSGGVKLRWIK